MAEQARNQGTDLRSPASGGHALPSERIACCRAMRPTLRASVVATEADRQGIAVPLSSTLLLLGPSRRHDGDMRRLVPPCTALISAVGLAACSSPLALPAFSGTSTIVAAPTTSATVAPPDTSSPAAPTTSVPTAEA